MLEWKLGGLVHLSSGGKRVDLILKLRVHAARLNLQLSPFGIKGLLVILIATLRVQTVCDSVASALVQRY